MKLFSMLTAASIVGAALGLFYPPIVSQCRSAVTGRDAAKR